MNLENMDISPELREKAKACKTPEEIMALAKKEGYKLSEDELEAVSGGSWGSIPEDSECKTYHDI
ncbi:MAG: Nif11-like leader peptide family natural product precursor [Eggerthellaceae bacterium]|nr:Nif11-like leader peptide family natural product precursor [Eggerthellaceae bacterium]